MTQYREILRLHKQGISGRSIAACLSCSRNTVSATLQAAETLGIVWPLPDSVSDRELGERLFPEKGIESNRKMPDFDSIHRELGKSGVTLSLLWYEYSEACRYTQAIPFQYSQFCKLYNDYIQKTKATMRIHHKPGEKLEVDWAGQTAIIKDNISGEDIKAYVFVAALPYSGYSYVEAFLKMDMECWIQAHVNCFEYFGGATRILVPDNLKTGVDHASWSRTVINKTYNEMATYYDTVVIPARVRHPKDKASAEGTVGVISTWILASLRNQTFFSLYELNQEIRNKLGDFNTRAFQKRDGSRESVFLDEEQHCLTTLPSQAYELATWTIATVQFNYHVSVDRMNYSVPYEYIQNKVDIRVTSRVIEVFYKSCRIASHSRIFGKPGQYQTIPEHMPVKHQQYHEWNADRFVSWANRIGEHTSIVIRGILSSARIEQQGYRSCMALLKAVDKFSPQRLENACQRALSFTPTPSYKNVLSILKSGSDKLGKVEEPMHNAQSSEYGISRGSGYYGREDL
ncbi:MAG: IS21 family transposase [Candidatus Cloacimonadaceae bacterium]|nr:IS21 family transposase [Candidatus Cloacimonadaceae bacterium]